MSIFSAIGAVSPLGQTPDPNALGLSTTDTAAADPNNTGLNANDPNALTPSFGQTLSNAFDKVNDMQNHAGAMTKAFALGQTSDIHGVMIAGEQATIALQLTTQIRNKAVEAYQEVMKMSM